MSTILNLFLINYFTLFYLFEVDFLPINLKNIYTSLIIFEKKTHIKKYFINYCII